MESHELSRQDAACKERWLDGADQALKKCEH